MAKVEGPLLSLSAHGSLGNVLTFSERSKVNQVRFQKKQKDYENAARQPIRQAFSLGIELWNYLLQSDKEDWRQ